MNRERKNRKGLTLTQTTMARLFRAATFLVLGSCLSPIDFDVEIKGGALVVSGQVSTIGNQTIVTLGRTANVQRLPFPLTGAYVLLHDDQGGAYPFFESGNQDGIYRLDFAGEVGRSYYLEIFLPDGRVYKSAPERMPTGTVQKGLTYDFVRKEGVDGDGSVITQDYIEVYNSFSLPESKNNMRLKWDLEEAFILSPTDFPDPFGTIPPPCFVVQNPDPQRVTLFDGRETSTSSIDNLLVCSRIVDWSFLERHYFTVYQSSITDEAYEYWRKVNVLANQVGSIFDTPPALIVGNVKSSSNADEFVLGYFQAVNQTYSRFFTTRDNLDFPFEPEPCTFDGSYNSLDYPSRCIDCTTVRNSSYERPTYF